MPIVIALLGILLLFLLIARVKLNAFLAFIIVCLFVGIFQGMDLELLVKSIQRGIGNTLGFLVLIAWPSIFNYRLCFTNFEV